MVFKAIEEEKNELKVEMPEEEMLPEPRIWKRTCLRLLFYTIQKFGQFKLYYVRYGAANALTKQLHAETQNALADLYMMLKIKLKKKENAKLTALEKYISSTTRDVIDTKTLWESYEIMVRAIERLGITKIEQKRFPEEETMA